MQEIATLFSFIRKLPKPSKISSKIPPLKKLTGDASFLTYIIDFSAKSHISPYRGIRRAKAIWLLVAISPYGATVAPHSHMWNAASPSISDVILGGAKAHISAPYPAW